MNTPYTTHLICAPQLNGAATIGALLATPGESVVADTPLVLLHVDGQAQEVCAPEAGLVGSFVVERDEAVSSGDLLLTMEIEEKAMQLFPLLDEEPGFAPACTLPEAKPAAVDRQNGTLTVAPEAASLAARLALDLAEVPPGPDGVVDEDAVTDHVRDILIRWRKLKRLVVD
ncbi:Biotin-requiring enzyme [Formivibrio citricus]|uniref:Biotin-requiring enzyme n=1 Tax=Formivibrio citricus TaxID=83765 RepID=A0A1I4ZCG8_9NEIS|nr:biotin/lipoyl-containing protein [Formivibrio citricus]SFN47897.1 Biotin-requiring enzyme [Formivibrio citricus]